MPSGFSNPTVLPRFADAVLVERHDEWKARDCRYHSEASMDELGTTNTKDTNLAGGTLLAELTGA